MKPSQRTIATNAELRSALGPFFDEPFPPDSSVDPVSELHAELAAYDGYLAGVVHSHWQGSPVTIPTFDSELMKRMRDALDRYPEAATELRAYISYLEKWCAFLDERRSRQ